MRKIALEALKAYDSLGTFQEELEKEFKKSSTHWLEEVCKNHMVVSILLAEGTENEELRDELDHYTGSELELLKKSFLNFFAKQVVLFNALSFVSSSEVASKSVHLSPFYSADEILHENIYRFIQLLNHMNNNSTLEDSNLSVDYYQFAPFLAEYHKKNKKCYDPLKIYVDIDAIFKKVERKNKNSKIAYSFLAEDWNLVNRDIEVKVFKKTDSILSNLDTIKSSENGRNPFDSSDYGDGPLLFVHVDKYSTQEKDIPKKDFLKNHSFALFDSEKLTWIKDKNNLFPGKKMHDLNTGRHLCLC